MNGDKQDYRMLTLLLLKSLDTKKLEPTNQTLIRQRIR